VRRLALGKRRRVIRNTRGTAFEHQAEAKVIVGCPCAQARAASTRP